MSATMPTFIAALLAVACAISSSAQTFLDDEPSANYSVRWNGLIDQAIFNEDAKALPILQEALKLCNHFSDAIREAATLRALGKIAGRQQQHARAVQLLEPALFSCGLSGSGSNTYATTVVLDLASEYAQLNKFAQAKRLLEDTLSSVVKQEGSDSTNYAKTNQALGFVYFKLKDYARAERCFLQATRSFKQSQADQGMIDESLNLAAITSMYRPLRAGDERFLLDAIKINQQLHFPDRASDFVRLGVFYYKTGKPKKSEAALLRAIALFVDCRACCGGSHGFSCGPFDTLDSRLNELFRPDEWVDMNVTVDDTADEKLARKILGQLKHPGKCPH